MGQYYRPVIKQEDKVTTFETCVNNNFVMSKLMEHSWIGNYFTEAISRFLYKNPAHIAWVGDYADEYGTDMPDTENWYYYAYSDKFLTNTLVYDTNENFTVNNRFIVNHTLKLYIDIERYKQHKETQHNSGHIIHPLPLMTAIGNGLGGGDYHSELNREHVGAWAGDKISIEDNIPENYQCLDICFAEKY